MTSHRAREKNYEWHRQNPGAPDAYGKDEYGKVAPPEWRTLKFYQHHKFYLLLGVEYDATRDQVKARGKKLMRYLDPASERWKELYQAMSCLVYGYPGERANYDRHGDIQPLHSLHVPAAEGQQEPWNDRRPSEYRLPPPQILDRWDVFEFRKELARLPSKKDAKGAASGKLSTHNLDNMNPHDRVTYSKKELDILASMKDAKGAASGKLSTHNQFGSASTWNPYFI